MAEVLFGLDGINWWLESTLAKAAHSHQRVGRELVLWGTLLRIGDLHMVLSAKKCTFST